MPASDQRPDSHPELPVDPDAPATGPERPAHLDPRLVAWVALGGVAGTAARIGVGDALPRPGGFPLPTLVINVAGALVLGALLEALARRGPDEGARRLLRLGLGTGVCGAFTTYSTFAVDTDLLVHDHQPALAVVYLVASLVLGLAATAAGVSAAARRHRAAARDGRPGEPGGPTA